MSVPIAVNQRAEWSVIAGLMLYREPRYVTKLVTMGMRGQDFYWSQNAALFDACVQIADRNGLIDSVTLLAALADTDGPRPSQADIDELASYAPVAGHLAEYATIVMDLARWRERWATVLRLREAYIAQDDEAWDRAYGPDVPAMIEPEPAVVVPHLRLVDKETGEVVKPTTCAECRKTEDQLAGANRDLRGWRARYAELAREKDAAAQASEWWPQAMALFKVWKRLTGHTRSKWTYDRFHAIEPMLKTYKIELCERAIAGLAYDPYKRPMRNGKIKKYDEWDRPWKSADKFEEFCNRAPLDFENTLHAPAPAPVVAAVAEVQAEIKQPVAAG